MLSHADTPDRWAEIIREVPCSGIVLERFRELRVWGDRRRTPSHFHRLSQNIRICLDGRNARFQIGHARVKMHILKS